MDVVVVGAGLGGLAAAVALRAAGHEVTVLERSPEPRETGSGLGVPPNGVRALATLGIDLRPYALPAGDRTGTRDRRGRLLLGLDEEELVRRAGAPMCMPRRRQAHQLLADALPAGVVRAGTPVEAVRPDGEVAGHGPAELVVVADGARSRLRAGLFPEHPGLVGSGEWAVRGIVPRPDVPLAVGELLDFRGGDRFGCHPMADGGVYWYAAWRAGAPPADPDPLRSWLVDRYADWHPGVPALVAATPPADVHVGETTRLAHPLPTLVSGRVALLGDAAHAMTPDLGQGASQAFEDAVVLGAVLRGAGPADVPAALRAYDGRRCRRVAALHRDSGRAQRILGLTGPAGRARDLGMRLLSTTVSARVLAGYVVDLGPESHS